MIRSGPDDATLTELALTAGRGDRRALERFVRATQRDVWRFVAHLADAHVADDLAQETYARALRSLPGFTGSGPARMWLLAIARCVVIDQVRAAAARPRIAADVDWQRAADRRPAPGFADLVALNLLLDGLAEDRREALVLTQVLGLSYADAARICDCPVGTIRSRVARAREDLLFADDERRTGQR